jgi:hypothetical protein
VSGKKKVRDRKPKGKATKRVASAAVAEVKDERYLGWRVAEVDFGGAWGWANMAPGDMERLRHELVEFEKEPIWSLKRKRWLKLIPVDDMKQGASDRLTEIDREDDGLWQLHLLHHKWRVWGFLEGATFFFLWWDPDHTVATGACRNRSGG